VGKIVPQKEIVGVIIAETTLHNSLLLIVFNN
jgi:hypothetical protein